VSRALGEIALVDVVVGSDDRAAPVAFRAWRCPALREDAVNPMAGSALHQTHPEGHFETFVLAVPVELGYSRHILCSPLRVNGYRQAFQSAERLVVGELWRIGYLDRRHATRESP
jgi:hypothetical protein